MDGMIRVLRSYLSTMLGCRKTRHFSGKVDPQWDLVQSRIAKSRRLIDLGCGGSPHPRALVGVDAYLAPVERHSGRGPVLDSAMFRSRGVKFVNASLESLPFKDKQFDFAYSHHAFEHLADPKKACAEMCRIAQAGAIITPSIFGEIAFGRIYHRWLVIARNNLLIFIRKMPREDRPFGEEPVSLADGTYRATDRTNPFEILLNWNGWYRGKESMPRLGRLLQEYWYSHSPVTEVVFLWETSFKCLVIDENGNVE